MRRVKKSVLVPFSTDAMFELVDRSSSTREFLPWCGDARTLETRDDGKTARIDIDFHGVRAHFTTDNVNRRRRIDRRHAAGRALSSSARRVAVPRARARRLQGRIRDRLRVRHARSRDGRGTGLQPRREHVDRRVRPSRRSGLTRAIREGHRRLGDAGGCRTVVDVGSAGTARRSPTPSTRPGFVAQYGIDTAQLGFAVYGRRASPETVLAEGDRIDLTRPLEVDPKAARIARARAKAVRPRSPRRASAAIGRKRSIALIVAESRTMPPVRPARPRCPSPARRAARRRRCRLIRPSAPRRVATRVSLAAAAATVKDAAAQALEHGAGPVELRARADRHPLQVGRQHPGNGARLQRPRPLRVPEGHRRDAAANGQGHEPPRRAGDGAGPASPAISSSSIRAASRSRTSASISATTVSSMRRGAAARWRSRRSTPSFWQKRFNGARRMVGVLPDLMPAHRQRSGRGAARRAGGPLPSPARCADAAVDRRRRAAPAPPAVLGSRASRAAPLIRGAGARRCSASSVRCRVSPNRARSRRRRCAG